MKYLWIQIEEFNFDVELMWVPMWMNGLQCEGPVFVPPTMAGEMKIPADQTN